MSKDWFILSLGNVKWLFGYYFILLTLGLLTVAASLVIESNFENSITYINLIAIIGGIGAAIVGCTVFYSRKLYKACINDEIIFEGEAKKGREFQKIGVLAYFSFRPVFAIAFSLIINVALKLSVQIVTVEASTLNSGFVYVSIFLSFIGGFAAGDMLTYLENKSGGWIEKVINQM